jgi:hypothetical protein
MQEPQKNLINVQVDVDVLLLKEGIQVTIYSSADDEEGTDVLISLDDLVKEVIENASPDENEAIAHNLIEASKDILCNLT